MTQAIRMLGTTKHFNVFIFELVWCELWMWNTWVKLTTATGLIKHAPWKIEFAKFNSKNRAAQMTFHRINFEFAYQIKLLSVSLMICKYSRYEMPFDLPLIHLAQFRIIFFLLLRRNDPLKPHFSFGNTFSEHFHHRISSKRLTYSRVDINLFRIHVIGSNRSKTKCRKRKIGGQRQRLTLKCDICPRPFALDWKIINLIIEFKISNISTSLFTWTVVIHTAKHSLCHSITYKNNGAIIQIRILT